VPALQSFPHIEGIVMELWEQKLQLNEKDTIKQIPELNDFIQREINKCHSLAENIEETAVRTDMLDAFFRMVIQTYNGDY
jgi:hypothetical protein